MDGVMQILRLLNRQARSTWVRVWVSSKPANCSKSVVHQGTKGEISLCARPKQANNKGGIYL